MASSPVLIQSSNILGKRKTRNDDSYILYLASSPEPNPQSDSDFELQPRSQSTASSSKLPPILINGTLVPNTKRRYKCTYQGCDKSYTKPSRLDEHERSHTGQRPFICPTCTKSYLRESHLQAHTRSHLPESSRPLACPESNCSKRFWTAQHLRVHEDWHNGARPFLCPTPSCNEAFAKHHQLRSHICSTHAPPGTKLYQCAHEGCDKSFTTNQKLRTHSKVHDEKRYTCIHPTCLPHPTTTTNTTTQPTYYPTWTSLQHHLRTAHPPTCTHPTCNGKTFSSQKGLRAHMKIHEEREVELQLEVGLELELGCGGEGGGGGDGDGEEGGEDGGGYEGEGEEGGSRPRKKQRRRGGEMGRDWVCDVEGCGKDFKSKKALTTHTNVTHLGRRDHVCPHQACGRAFGYKHLLQRHLGRVHPGSGTGSGSGSNDNDDDNGDEDEDEDDDEGKDTDTDAPTDIDIDLLTGTTYARRAAEKVITAKALMCPYPHDMDGLVYTASAADASTSGLQLVGGKGCGYVFSRAYDLRRHLKSTHGVEVQKESVEGWVGERRARAMRG